MGRSRIGLMSSSDEICRIYERTDLRRAGGGVIRPGGLKLTQRALAAAALPPGSRVLDMGCGTGVTLGYLIHQCRFRGVGIDLSINLLDEGRGQDPGLPLAQALGAHLPFIDAAVGAILAECSLSLMEDVGRALDECARVLKPGGILLVHDVYARSPESGSRLKGLPLRCCLTGAVSREEWIERIEGAGFEVTHWEDQSQALKEFAARLIFSHGSLESFWCGSGGGGGMEAGREIQQAVASAKPGYFLAIARKVSGAP